ncbi:MAG: ERF family protein [Aeriscardovia sp.]|nr:ERF family protein [Aeriscardovia sp.]MBR6843441.1 ERF family protein [Prevotella sp.]
METKTEVLALNAKLQMKKNALRKMLKEKGVLKKGGKNEFSKYSYFTEAQYKELFTELFSEAGLELKFTEIEYATFDAGKSNGRMPKLQFTLMDIDTGYGEETVITGEGLDTGDKAGYKAYTGALKYYLANTFMVATGDDPEKDSPTAKTGEKKATPNQIEFLRARYQGENREKLLKANNLEKIEDISAAKASEIIEKWKKAAEKKEENA